MALFATEEEFVPHMLAELEDELARSRKREAFWISLVVHITIVLLIFLLPQYLPHWARPHLLTDKDLHKQETTFLTLPPDRQTPPKEVHTDQLSDKNRIAQSPHPQIDRKTLEALRQGNRRAPGLPGAPAQTTQQAPAQPQVAEVTPPQILKPPSNLPSPAQPPQAEPQEQTGENPFKGQGSAGDLIAHAARGTGRGGSFGAGGSGYGMGRADRNVTMGPIEVLSDTQGVDFGPYLSRAIESIRMNWYTLIPEEARAPLMKHGRVAIRFLIFPPGKVAGMNIDKPSGEVPLDRAAWGGITASDPFPPLPGEFHGPYLELRVTFFYNPIPGEMESYQY